MDAFTKVYFFYSSEHITEKNKVEANIGRRFVCGTVIHQGTKKKFSFMSTDKYFLQRYPDARIVAEGYKEKMQYEEPKSEPRRGN